QAVAVVEGLQDSQPDSVPVEGDRLLIPRAPPHDPQRTHGKVRWPARTPRLCTHGGSLHRTAPASPAASPIRAAIGPQYPPPCRPAADPARRPHHPLAARASIGLGRGTLSSSR